MKAEDFLTIEEIATLLRVQVSAVRARISRDDASLPPSLRIGGRRLFPRSLYIKWRDSLLVADAAKPPLDEPSDVQSAIRACNGLPEGLPNCDLREMAAGALDAPNAEAPTQ